MTLLESAWSTLHSVVLVAAHCVAGSPQQSISVASVSAASVEESSFLAAENVVLHPEYNGTVPSGQHDLAVVKVKNNNNISYYY